MIEYIDWRLDAIVAMENAIRELRTVKERLAEEVRRDDACFAAIMDKVKEERRALSFTALRQGPGLCTDGDDPPSRAL